MRLWPSDLEDLVLVTYPALVAAIFVCIGCWLLTWPFVAALIFGLVTLAFAGVASTIVGLPLVRLQRRMGGHYLAWLPVYISVGFLGGAAIQMLLFGNWLVDFSREAMLLAASYGAVGVVTAISGWGVNVSGLARRAAEAHNNALQGTPLARRP